MLQLLEKIQRGYTPFLITLLCLFLALFFTWIQKPNEKSDGKIQEPFLTKLFGVFGLALGSFLRSSEVLAINSGKHSADGLPFAGPFIFMAAAFLLAHTYLTVFVKRSEEFTRNNGEHLAKEMRSRFLLVIALVIVGGVEMFLRF